MSNAPKLTTTAHDGRWVLQLVHEGRQLWRTAGSSTWSDYTGVHRALRRVPFLKPGELYELDSATFEIRDPAGWSMTFTPGDDLSARSGPEFADAQQLLGIAVQSQGFLNETGLS